MSGIWHAIRGPRLFRIFRHEHEPGRNYEPRLLESGADKVIGSIRFFWSLTYWTSPLLLGILYRRGHFTSEGMVNLGKYMLYIASLYYMAHIFRGIGRVINPDYMQFITVLLSSQKVFHGENRKLLARYDFEYWASPVLWKWQDVNIGEVKKSKIQAEGARTVNSSILYIPQDILSYMCAHTFGRRMVYPGATALINTLVEGPLCQGRAKLVEENNGDRGKLLTEDGNEIDTMFMDRRSSGSSNGKTLVVCCEGNAGFYEMGAIITPLSLGYSVIGWNHPGFAGSTGVPFPAQEQCAIDAVMQYSIHKLGFTPDNIILYAWSIGGYAASWAAMNYPDVQHVILDATFDELMPLAMAKMPAFAKSLVERTVLTYLNLDNVSQLIKYPGPILLIRRSKDEMITTRDPTAIETNRGNFMLVRLLNHRYPNIVDESSIPILQDWLQATGRAQARIVTDLDADFTWCEVAIRSYMEEHGKATYPLDIGTDYTDQQKAHMTVFLASKYMEDFDSTHCTSLPAEFFHKPWSPLL